MSKRKLKLSFDENIIFQTLVGEIPTLENCAMSGIRTSNSYKNVGKHPTNVGVSPAGELPTVKNFEMSGV